MFEHFHEVPNVTHHFVSLFNDIVGCCPLTLYNFAEEGMINAIFTALKKNPYKYSMLLDVFEKIVTLNKASDYMKGYMQQNTGPFCGQFHTYLGGKWQDSDFLSHFLKLLSSILKFKEAQLLKQPEFEGLNTQLLQIFQTNNFYENRRDILKFW